MISIKKGRSTIRIALPGNWFLTLFAPLRLSSGNFYAPTLARYTREESHLYYRLTGDHAWYTDAHAFHIRFHGFGFRLYQRKLANPQPSSDVIAR